MKDSHQSTGSRRRIQPDERTRGRVLLTMWALLIGVGTAIGACNSDQPARRGSGEEETTTDTGDPSAQRGGNNAAGEGSAGSSSSGKGGSSGRTDKDPNKPESGGGGNADPVDPGGTQEVGGAANDAGADSSTDASSDAPSGASTNVVPGIPFTTSCDKQKCASGESCVEGGYGGTYCAKPCPGQRNCPSGTAYCERNGGVICVKK